jgi:hypothetical protein
MSIRGVIRAKEGTELWRFEPPNRLPLKRRLFLTSTARKHLTDLGSVINVLGVRGYVQNAMVRWVTGGLVHADERGKARFIKRLCPPPSEVWEIRVTDPIPQIRLLGRMVEPDTLVLARFHTRQHLGDKNVLGSGWKAEMSACDAEISAIFAGEPLMMKHLIGDYVTENRHDYRLCPP